ncbi:survival protein sure-like phosphatase/nucleotidase [Podospora aff. communis PSN243]|uniref:Survival protein sure-like phosphatase/nucleotidase n=1 Tax=Podospora aff. communis PSN243 TaxID=3040156 RepID=A0AAV9G6D7_9PEZI|nr:survival protein sure-like phosphatase/nucleotidase [Podospora aff. communis PSN243]
MRRHSILAAWAALASVSHGLNILLTNDDGFATANIRELYRELKSQGHACYIVAPVTDPSAVGEQTFFTTNPKLTTDSEWGIVKAGSSSIGTDPQDDHIWYYNGTQAAQILVALDYILPTFGTFHTPDLVISGPNVGWTVGPFVYTVAGTLGAIIAAIERGVPAISFSSANTDARPYQWVNSSTKAGLDDPATINAHLASSLVQSMIDKAAGAPILPKGYGIAVNMPYITSHSSDDCTNPPFVPAHIAGSATAKAKYDPQTGLFGLSVEDEITTANRLLQPSKRDVASQCTSSVTVFTVHYDPDHDGQCILITNAAEQVPVVVTNGTTSNSSGSVVVIVGNSSDPSPAGPAPAPTITGLGVKSQWSMTALILSLGIAAFAI